MDINDCSIGINGIFDEFFNEIGRTVNNFACFDLIDNMLSRSLIFEA